MSGSSLEPTLSKHSFRTIRSWFTPQCTTQLGCMLAAAKIRAIDCGGCPRRPRRSSRPRFEAPRSTSEAEAITHANDLHRMPSLAAGSAPRLRLAPRGAQSRLSLAARLRRARRSPAAWLRRFACSRRASCLSLWLRRARLWCAGDRISLVLGDGMNREISGRHRQHTQEGTLGRASRVAPQRHMAASPAWLVYPGEDLQILASTSFTRFWCRLYGSRCPSVRALLSGRDPYPAACLPRRSCTIYRAGP